MKIETLPREDHQLQITAELDSAELESFKRRAARQIANRSKIPGFRPGKAPYDVIKRFYGEEAIQHQAIELLVDDAYPKILKEANIDPAGPGHLEEIISIDPPKFLFVVPLAPEITLPDYRSMRKEYNLPPVTDEDVAKVIQSFQRSNATAEPVERPAELGDLVYMKFSADFDHPQESEEAVFFPEMPGEFIVGEPSPEMGNWPYEGFSNELIGLSAGSEKEIHYTYPEDIRYERIRGKSVTFHISIQSVKKLALPDMDDEFAKTAGEFETFEEMKTMLRKQMEEANVRHYDDQYLDEFIDEITAQSTIKYPPQALEQEIEHYLKTFEQELANDQMDLDTYLKTNQMDRETFIEKEAKPEAKHRLERSFVLDELASLENIEFTKEELHGAILQRMINLQEQGKFDFQKLAKKKGSARKIITEKIALDTAGRLLSQNTMMRLKAIATGQVDVHPEAEHEAISENATEQTEPSIAEDTPIEAELSASENNDEAENIESELKTE